MKIFDSSQLIAIFNHINRPNVFEDISQLGHELVIPHYVMAELHDTNTRKNVKRLLKEGKLKLLDENSIEEIREFQEQIYKLEDGETDVILTCQKLGGYQNNVYCILDDKDARRAALKLNVKRRGLGIVRHVRREESRVQMKLKRLKHYSKIPILDHLEILHRILVCYRIYKIL